MRISLPYGSSEYRTPLRITPHEMVQEKTREAEANTVKNTNEKLTQDTSNNNTNMKAEITKIKLQLKGRDIVRFSDLLDPATNDIQLKNIQLIRSVHNYVQTIRYTENERRRIRKREGATVQNGSGC